MFVGVLWSRRHTNLRCSFAGKPSTLMSGGLSGVQNGACSRQFNICCSFAIRRVKFVRVWNEDGYIASFTGRNAAQQITESQSLELFWNCSGIALVMLGTHFHFCNNSTRLRGCPAPVAQLDRAAAF